MKEFPVVDITHKPKRLQRDNIIAAGTIASSEQDDDQGEPVPSVPLHNVTIERAIEYYETHAEGELTTLYLNTAEWLRQLLAVGLAAAKKAEQEVKKGSESVEKNEVQEGEQT